MSVQPATFIAGACGAGSWPQNTAGALRRCLDAPVHGVEVDLHLSQDGVVVAHHDYRLSPDATRRDGVWIEAPGPRIKDLTAADLARYDVGTAREGSRIREVDPVREHWDNASIPRFSDLLSILSNAPGAPRELYAEIKTDPQRPDESSDYIALAKAVVRDLDQAEWTAHSRIIAFDWRVLRLCHEIAPNLATAHLVVPRAMEGQVRRDADGGSPWTDGCDPLRFGGSLGRAIAAHGGRMASLYFKDIDAPVMNDLRAAGVAVAAWGLVEPRDIAAMLHLGVTSLTVEGPHWRPSPEDLG